jgi:ketosteroid isomerase-like protein
MSSANVGVIRRLNAAFNAGDWEAYQDVLHPEMEFHDHMPLPDAAQSARGREEMKAVLEHWREGFTGFHAQVLEYIDIGDYVVCSTRWNFVSRDGGIELEWPGAEAHQVKDGQIVWTAAGFHDVAAAARAVEQRQPS